MSRLILALDEIQDLDEVLSLVKNVGHLFYAVKIHNLYDKFGPTIVDKLREAGADKVWVDHKLYDIPNTGKLRAESINADIISVHASGGLEMMKQVVSTGKTIFAVSILTSFSTEEVEAIYNRRVDEAVLFFAELAQEAGVSGLVCSPQEINMLRSNSKFANLKLVVPGIRSEGVNSNDQSRVGTPAQALQDGADYLVVGRQITKSNDPKMAAQALYEEVNVYKLG